MLDIPSFAVIPAAGRSVRMGSPKLLLPWGKHTLIEHVLAAWKSAGIERRVVVVHRDDHALAELAANAGADVVAPDVPPPDMKASVQAALAYIAERHAPGAQDVWLLAPADMPNLSPAVIRSLVTAATQHPGAIVAPTYQGRRGHPVLFRWKHADAVQRLGPDEGVNQLLRAHPVFEVPVSSDGVLQDIDTPEEYRRIIAE